VYYRAIYNKDVLTLQASMFLESIFEEKPVSVATSLFQKPKAHKIVHLSEEEEILFNTLVKEIDFNQLLNLSLVALSNRQM